MYYVKITLKSGVQIEFTGTKQNISSDLFAVYQTSEGGIYCINLNDISASYEKPI